MGDIMDSIINKVKTINDKTKITIILLDQDNDKKNKVINEINNRKELLLLNEENNISSKGFTLESKMQFEVIKSLGYKYYIVRINKFERKRITKAVDFEINIKEDIKIQIDNLINMINEDIKFKNVLNVLSKI